jgi:hypothetical protein
LNPMLSDLLAPLNRHLALTGKTTLLAILKNIKKREFSLEKDGVRILYKGKGK